MNKLMEVWSLCRDVITLQVQQFVFSPKVFSIIQEKVAL
jgi:hypothetical protein